MHNKKLIIWHVLGWAVAFLFFNRRLLIFGFSSATLYNLVTFFFYGVIFYGNMLWTFPSWLKHRRPERLMFEWLGIFFMSWVIAIVLNSLLLGVTFTAVNKFLLLTLLLKTTLYVGISLFLSTTYCFVTQWFENERTRLRLENEKLQIELDFLHSQVNPHFLFNTLNNIYSLIQQNSTRAGDALLNLSQILQFILYDCRADKILLSRELEHLPLLMALQQLRIRGPMMLEFLVEGDVKDYQIAPLILISLIENVFKHGVLDDPEDPALIKIFIHQNQLSFQSRNKVKHITRQESKGIGLSNVARRLELLYCDQHKLDIQDNGQYFSVDLNLNLV